jgi:hypothetical protein
MVEHPHQRKYKLNKCSLSHQRLIKEMSNLNDKSPMMKILKILILRCKSSQRKRRINIKVIKLIRNSQRVYLRVQTKRLDNQHKKLRVA